MTPEDQDGMMTPEQEEQEFDRRLEVFIQRYPWLNGPAPRLSCLRPCAKPDCPRLVGGSSAYCCGPCSAAAAGKYEIHAHSPGCDQRAQERGTA